MADWADWIGREQRAADRLDPGLAARWHATFDHGAPASTAMPQGIHFCLCTPEAPTARLGPDGHPLREDDPADWPDADPRFELDGPRFAAFVAREDVAPVRVGACWSPQASWI